MNINRIVYLVNNHCDKNEWGDAVSLLKLNLGLFNTREKAQMLNSNGRTLLKNLLESENKNIDSQSSIEKKPSYKSKIDSKDKKEVNDKKFEKEMNYIINTINSCSSNLNWKKARSYLENKLAYFQEPKYRSKLNAEAKIILEVIEKKSK